MILHASSFQLIPTQSTDNAEQNLIGFSYRSALCFHASMSSQKVFFVTSNHKFLQKMFELEHFDCFGLIYSFSSETEGLLYNK